MEVRPACYIEAVKSQRRSVASAVRACRRGEVVAARTPEGEEVAVVRLISGQVCVMADRCPHDGGLLSDGFVEADRLVCARHQWEIDPRTGERVSSCGDRLAG
jgi:nitrite reductase/ring-hydroxylating ferredoxin subunit